MNKASPGADKIKSIASEAEGTVLGVIARRQPLTRYTLLRAFQTSAIVGVHTSKGSLYPLVHRLVERGLLAGEAGSSDRGTEVLRLTPKGRRSLRDWVQAILPRHALQHDPLKMRAISLGELPREGRLQWVTSAKEIVRQKKEELGEYRKLVRLPYGKLVHEADEASLDAQLRWLDQLLAAILDEEHAETRSQYAWESD